MPTLHIPKRYIEAGMLILIISFSASTCIYHNINKTLEEELAVSVSNQKAFILENSSLKEENRVFKFTVEQLNYYNDSILQKMNDVRKRLKIKDKDLSQIHYLLSEASRRDTITFRDTLFREPALDIDTLIGDGWYQVRLGLEYPSTITVAPKFISEKYIVVESKKETVNPPKKCWLLRLFQKKHKISVVDVVEKNPYIEDKQQRFIEIIE